jgi:hypothetical protein
MIPPLPPLPFLTPCRYYPVWVVALTSQACDTVVAINAQALSGPAYMRPMRHRHRPKIGGSQPGIRPGVFQWTRGVVSIQGPLWMYVLVGVCCFSRSRDRPYVAVKRRNLRASGDDLGSSKVELESIDFTASFAVRAEDRRGAVMLLDGDELSFRDWRLQACGARLATRRAHQSAGPFDHPAIRAGLIRLSLTAVQVP